MKTPYVFLKWVTQALLNTVGAGALGELAVDLVPAVAQDVWIWWGRDLDEEKRRAEVEALAQVDNEEVSRLASRLVHRLASYQSPEVQKALIAYLSGIPDAIRQALRRPEDPTGTSLPPESSFRRPEDLYPLLPHRFSSPKQSPGKRSSRVRPPDPAPHHGQPAELQSAGRITLKVTEGPHLGQVFCMVGRDTFLVGRSNRATFQLKQADKFFSRMHFLVEANPPKCRILDLGSRNGTHVNGQRITAADLKDGDVIRAGHTVLRVSIEIDPTGTSNRTSEYIQSADDPEVASLYSMPHLSREKHQPSLSCSQCQGPVEQPGVTKLCHSCRARARGLPTAIASYRIVRELGRGGMGVVYLANQSEDGSSVALKTILSAVDASPTQLDRFLREARILEKLDHPHIVRYRAMGEEDGVLYFVMDYVEGTDAAKLLKIHGPLPVNRATQLVCQLLAALDYAHNRRFVHRDIKPANLLVSTARGQEVAHLADFGLARVYQASQLSGLTATGDVGGTVAFMPPEQITSYRDVRPEADQYAAAATLYNLLTAKFVYDLPGNPEQRMLMILQDDPVPIRSRCPDLPKRLASVIHRALARDPQDRFPTAAHFRENLLPFTR